MPLTRKEFDRLVVSSRANLTFTAVRIVGSDNADDCVQSALAFAWMNRSTFEDSGNNLQAFLAWLHAILSYECATLIQQHARRKETTLPSNVVFDLCDGPGAPAWQPDQWLAQRDELYRRLHRATLTERQRECTLRWLLGESLAQIAPTFSISPVAVWKIIRGVGHLLAGIDDEAYLTTTDVRECIDNLPAALTYPGQVAQWARIRKQANRAYCQQQARKTGR